MPKPLRDVATDSEAASGTNDAPKFERLPTGLVLAVLAILALTFAAEASYCG